MDEFSFLDYCTEYSSKGDVNVKMGKAACFSRIFRCDKRQLNNSYVIKIHKGLDFIRDTRRNNACLLTRKEVRNHIKLLNSIHPIECKVLDKKDHYEVRLHINGPIIFHKYALTWVRYLYEHPYNLFIVDAYKLKKLPMFTFSSIADLFNTVLSCYPCYVRDIHQIPKNVVVNKLTIKKLKKTLFEARELNYIYGDIGKKRIYFPKQFGKYHCDTDYEYWESEESFNIRKEVYLKSFKLKR